MHLLLIRHGATQTTAEQRYTGQADVPLSELGVRQARALGTALAQTDLAAIVSSDLQRARLTADAIAAHHHLTVRHDPALRELAMGDWEGATYAEIAARDPAALARWQDDPVASAPPSGETVAALRERLCAALDQWQTHLPEGIVTWVMHGGAITVLIAHLLGMDLRRRWQLRCDPASITALDLYPGDYPAGYTAIVERLNDCTHLASLDDESNFLSR